MSNRDIEKRLGVLEKIIKSSDDTGIWVHGLNNVIHLNMNFRGSKEYTFPTTFEAARWLEKQIDSHPSAIGSYSVDNICDLYEDGEELKAIIRKIIPEPIIPPQKNVPLSGGVPKPRIFSADSLYASLFAHLKTDQPADLNLWCLANVIEQYFCDAEFRERYQNGVLSDDDINMNFILYIIYSWDKEEPSINYFARLFRQVVGLLNTPYAEKQA
jgi:hypothetical protein